MGPDAATRPVHAAPPWHLLDLLGMVKEALHVDTATLLVLDRAEQLLDCVAALGNDDALRHPFRVPVGRGFAGRVALDRAPVALERVDADTVLNPAILRAGVRSLLGVPLLRDGLLLGVLHVGSQHLRVFTAEDQDFLSRAAVRLAGALVAEDTEDALAERLQQLLMPYRAEPVPGLDLATRYVPADGRLGGDWYDAFQLPGGRVGLAIGDVMGHGLASSVVMTRVRSALRAYALEHVDPARVLALLDGKVATFEPDAIVTVAYAVTRPPFSDLMLASAGHLSPLLADPGGAVTQLEVPVGPPLGVGWPLPRETLRVPWPRGASLCFFTDGLVERRLPDQLTAGLDTLIGAFGAKCPEETCDRILAAELAQLTSREDDIALMVARRPELAGR